jgi:Ni/Fe-hydrogenase subunit HybB-like protein
MARHENRLILPWEEERNRMPRAARVVFFLIGVAVFIAVMINQCSA